MIEPEMRERVLGDLRGHWQAGRIDADEHERRTVVARNADTPDELSRALDGLPETGRTGAGMLVLGESADVRPGRQGASAAGLERVPGNEVARRDRTNGLVRVERRVANSIMAIVPILAVIAFFTTGQWLWFLAIPLVSIVLFGKGDDKGGG